VKKSARHPTHRGIVTRLFAMVLGLIIASALILSLQLTFVHQRATIHIATASLVDSGYAEAPIAWPTIGSAAIDIPTLGVTRSWHNAVVPIASLTKMMTAYVVLKKYPLGIGQTGPCITVSEDDVVAFDEDKTLGDSSVIVEEGEPLCESVLLDGMLVHSAANYADMLAAMVAPTNADFVALMNRTALSLGLRHTHYDDDAGVSNNSVSTALDQATLAALLMKSPLVRSIVSQTEVDLPVAGDENSFTPFVGTDNVVGVKSGRTDAAGGCDVLARAFRQGGRERIVYAVVLGQRGGDLLGPAGNAALALANSALANRSVHTFTKGTIVGHVGFGHDVAPIEIARTSRLYVWGEHASLDVSVKLRHLHNSVRRGEVVGWLVVPGVRHPLALEATRSVAQTTLWHRIA
jgi:D-alanyl-D-alanine carboxypeptidase (penicillin-binding protein 5/6)